MGYLRILLDNQNFTTGQTIHGKVEFTKSRGLSANGVYIELVVTEYTNETATEDSYPKSKTNVLHKMKLLLAGGKGKSFNTDAGAYTWPFSFQLPTNLPSSICHPKQKAYVLYEMKALFDAPGCIKECSSKVAVQSPNDAIPKPVHNDWVREQKTFWFAKTPLYLEARLENSSAVPGQQLFAEISIDNQSNKSVNSLQLQLVQLWKFPKGTDRIVVMDHKVTLPEFPINPSQKFKSRIGFTLPTGILPSTSLTKLFSMSYVISLNAVVKSPELNVDLPLSISLVSNKPSIPNSDVTIITTHTVTTVPVPVPVYIPVPVHYEEPHPHPLVHSSQYPMNPSLATPPYGQPLVSSAPPMMHYSQPPNGHIAVPPGYKSPSAPPM